MTVPLLKNPSAAASSTVESKSEVRFPSALRTLSLGAC